MEDLEEILSWFDITERQRSIIESRVRDLIFTSFDAVYTHVAYLVDFLNDYFAKKQQLSLERMSRSRQDRMLAVEDEGLHLLWHEHELMRAECNLSSEDAYYFLMDKLPEQDLDLLMQLMQKTKVQNILKVTARDLSEDLSGVQARIQQVRDRFTIGGRLRIPERVIKDISFDPLEITYVLRNFQGDPLQYFRDHIEIYEGLGRMELKQLDPGLFSRLTALGQLEEAIPEYRGNRPADADETEEILAAHAIYGGVVKRAADATGWSVQTIKRKWEGAELEINDGRALSEEDNQRILEAHALYKGNGKEASRHLPYPYQTILRKWKEEGLRPSKKRSHLADDKVEMIVAAHETYEGNAAEAAKHLPFNHKTIRRYWKSHGLKPSGGFISEEGLATILAAHEMYAGNGLEAAQHLPFHYLTILRKWEAAGLKPKGKTTGRRHRKS